MNEEQTFSLDNFPADHKSGFVAVVGKPNVGKSTLVNRLVGQKVAIVSPKPQTTRSRILAILTREHAQVIFVDTPGIHRPRHELGKAMVDAATRTLPDSDVVAFVVDVSQPPSEADEEIAALIRQQTESPVILVMNKMDLLSADQVEAHTRAYWKLLPGHDDALPSITEREKGEDWMMTIATEGVNLSELLDRIIALLPQGPRYYPGEQVTDQTERQIAAELIREQVLYHIHQEVPHAVAVVVNEFKEREGGTVYIAANIFVEKDSQKGIIIGKGGKRLRKIGSAARREIERMTNANVYLDLWVKVNKGWRKDASQLRRLGLIR